MARSDTGVDVESLTPLHWIGILAAAVTGIAHVALGVQFGGTWMVLFFLATLGFGAGVAAVVANYRRRLVYALGIPFTAGQIVMWYVLNDVPPIPTSHAIDKVAQVVLIAVLAVLLSRES
ncbi:hypothetical protein EXE46_04615 [Halorubrum sp. GN11_10-6_MGM]|uniref:DUF7475 family protein n=1 Tax=Halorubrum sp. GN11_10-6_MGM TaxID=2518112 RepID=UPI0010F671AA|nr:hypothetical protein [Halorubrum sp. GN11_10-6_MGM]TKX75152.1 hypothetical protein EXE46_04615 [Halorubrum sp. GN11_10-6_MGM]